VSNAFSRFIAMLEREPAAAYFSIAGALVPVLAIWLHWDTKQTAAAAAILTALASILAAIKARPVSVPILLGGATTIVTALAAWHVNLPPADMATVTSAVSVILGVLLRVNLTPVVTLRPNG
jgi:hypothetical protein